MLVIVLRIVIHCVVVHRVLSREVNGILPFLELSGNASLFTGVDDASIVFQFPTPFYFNTETYTSAFISSNGLISFGGSFIEYSPQSFPINAIVISPYWDDIDLRNKGEIRYESYDSDSEILLTISDFINDQTSELKFEAISAVIIYWLNVCPHNNVFCLNTNTFQAVLVSNNNTSYAIFTYQCGLLNWVQHRASIGYSAGVEFYDNHFLSRRYNVNDIACLNEPHSKWSNVVYNTRTGSGSQIYFGGFGSGSESPSNNTLDNSGSGSDNGSDPNICSGSGQQCLPCTHACNPQYQGVEYEICCNPENFGKFHKIIKRGVHRGYLSCPEVAPDWCT